METCSCGKPFALTPNAFKAINKFYVLMSPKHSAIRLDKEALKKKRDLEKGFLLEVHNIHYKLKYDNEPEFCGLTGLK